MLVGLPDALTRDQLDLFTFGSADAQNDELLADCFYLLDPVREFLRDEASVMIGDRGAGKSAIFRLLCDGKISFLQRPGETAIIVPVAEELQYKTIQTSVIPRIKASLDSEVFPYRMVWELFLLYRIFIALDEHFGARLPQPLREGRERLKAVFGDKKKATILELFTSARHSIEFKLKAGADGSYTPSAAAAVEPGGTTSAGPADPCEFRLDDYKSAIQAFLQQEHCILYPLVDKVDDFVHGGDFKTQRKMLQGLMECERSYLTHNRIKLKLFLRKDLYGKLDTSSLGSDKLRMRTLEITWSDSDIRQFLARRISNNYQKIFELPQLLLRVDKEVLYVDPAADYTDTPDSISRQATVEESPPDALTKWFRRDRKANEDEGRVTSLTDHMAKDVVRSLLPAEVRHFSGKGTRETIDLFQFLGTHFLLGTGNTTPRIMMMFMRRLLEVVRSYYRDNPDAEIKLTGGRFKLIPQRVFQRAYTDFQHQMLESMTSSEPRWGRCFVKLTAERGKRTEFTCAELRTLSGVSEENNAKFAAYLLVIGYLEVKNPGAHLNDRVYRIPKMFQTRDK